METEIFDNSWVEEYERLEKDYELFYKETVESLKLFYIYVSKNRYIEHLHQDDVILNNGVLTKEKLLDLIKTNKYKNGIKYNLKHLLKYNISLDPEDIQVFLNRNPETVRNQDELHSYLKPILLLDDLCFEASITILQDLNCIYFIFIEADTQNTSKKLTRKNNKQRDRSHRKTRHKTT